MDALTELFELIRSKHLGKGIFLGLLHVFIGRTITSPKGTVISSGLTFRELATWFKKLRWDPDDVRELGLEPDTLPVRDRQRYWFVAICQAQVSSPAALKAADKFSAKLQHAGYKVGAAPQAQ
jgi:hypothetical protein